MDEDRQRLLSRDERLDERDLHANDHDVVHSPTESIKIDAQLAVAFIILGAGMLWPFNSFITANEFFRKSFHENGFLLRIYSPAITFTFTFVNLLSTIYFTRTVRTADLNKRVSKAALSTTALFAFLAILTTLKLKPVIYFSLLMSIVAITGVTIAAFQNGCFGLVGGYGPRYVQFIMIGQGIAGVTPAILSIAVALIGGDVGQSASKRAFAYFLSSSLVLASAYCAHLYLKSRPDAPDASALSGATAKPAMAQYRQFLKSYPPWTVFLVFTVTLALFPSVTASVTSVLPTEYGVPFKDLPTLLQPSVFVPLGFLVWNSGDLLARILSALPAMSCESPRLLFGASILRMLWIPIMYLCNVRGGGAIVKSDTFFFAVLLLFGMSNGFVGSSSIATAINRAGPDEKRDVGAFMTFMLCTGLVVGSLLSFLL